MAAVLCSSIVKRDEKLLESKRPVIPDHAGSQTSFRNQLQGLDGLGLRLLLYEHPPEPKPKVLLSHNVTMATLPGSNIAKRGESHPESQLPTVPDGTGGQTSCTEQLESTVGLGLRLLLYENRLEPKHKIFLSHSGAQKSFVKQLCKDIERYDRYPFFDLLRTSLSIGCHFPNAIFKAIRQCQVAVVVLSEDFFCRTKWPMLELSALVKRQGHDPSLIIMPVFWGLTRKECLEKKNQDHWLSLWKGWVKKDRRIHLHDWKAVFKVFGPTNSVSLCGGDEVKCREDIVDAVCNEVPPETRRDDSHVQGRTHMCKTIAKRIGSMELSKLYKVRVLGLHGMGGIGKSTACMTLCNYYFEEFHGRVCHVEFGVVDELYMLREILKRLTDTKHEQIEAFNLHECKGRIIKDFENRNILLALDNVFESNQIVQRAKSILRAGFAQKSIVIVTARSLGELLNLDIEESACMKMPELTVDDAISLFVREVACDVFPNDLIRKCVDRCYFRKGDRSKCHYHPLALRVLGGQLGSDSSKWLGKLEEIDVFNQYGEEFDTHPIFSILGRSFEILKKEDQLLFMDCALFATPFWLPFNTKAPNYHWLSMVHGEELKPRLNGLRQKSVIQTLEEGTTVIGIHDLWREFCVMKSKVGELKSRRWIYAQLNGSNDSFIEKSDISTGLWKNARRVSMTGPLQGTFNVHLNHIRCPFLGALHLENVELEGHVLDLNGVYNLKSLKIKTCSKWEVRGLGSLRQLCLLEWCGEISSNLTFIEEIGGLTNLQILNLSNYMSNTMKLGFPNLSNLISLQRVALCDLEEGVSLSFNTTMSNLQQLYLGNCKSLQMCSGISDFVKLEKLDIHSCPNLEELPNLQGWSAQGSSSVDSLVNLEVLSIEDCRSVDSLGGISKVSRSWDLHLSKCGFKDLACLKDLIGLHTVLISGCNLLESFPNMHKATRLEILHILDCENLRVWEGLNSARAISSEAIGVDLQSVGTFPNLRFLWMYRVAITELPDLSNFPQLRVLIIRACPRLVQLTSIVPLTSLISFSVTLCRSLTTIPNFSGYQSLRRISLDRNGVWLSEDEMKYLTILCPTIEINNS